MAAPPQSRAEHVAPRPLPLALSELITEDLLWDPASPVLGDPHGDATLIEFFDYRCPYCKVMAPKLAKLRQEDPKLRMVMKEYPVLGPASLVAARAALAVAEQGRYGAFHEAMFALAGPFDEAAVMAVVAKVGADPARVRVRMAAPEIAAELRRNLALGQLIGLEGTPDFIVGGSVVPGAVPLAALKGLIAKLRKGPKA